MLALHEDFYWGDGILQNRNLVDPFENTVIKFPSVGGNISPADFFHVPFNGPWVSEVEESEDTHLADDSEVLRDSEFPQFGEVFF